MKDETGSDDSLSNRLEAKLDIFLTDLETLLEIKELSKWTATQNKSVLKNKLNAIGRRAETLILNYERNVREQKQRTNDEARAKPSSLH